MSTCGYVHVDWSCTRLKRDWCPEWLWRLLCRRQLPVRLRIVRWATTRLVSEHEERRLNGPPVMYYTVRP